MSTTFPGDQSAGGNPELFDRVQAGLSGLQEFQKLYDADLWMIKKPDFAKFRHITHHLQVVAGQMSGFCEGWEHQVFSGRMDAETLDIATIRNELAPHLADLLMFTAQLANLAQIDLAPTLLQRSVVNSQRFAPQSSFAEMVSGIQATDIP